mmetsp:Transcript_7874/g.9123  ORF Transcript_7874/g.9123 Transcript_7874/m.9123 type:complete len:100 (-) Transcript_7874:692-991(-)
MLGTEQYIIHYTAESCVQSGKVCESDSGNSLLKPRRKDVDAMAGGGGGGKSAGSIFLTCGLGSKVATVDAETKLLFDSDQEGVICLLAVFVVTSMGTLF